MPKSVKKHPSGVANGTIVEIPVHGKPNEEIKIRREKVVHESDGTWHKVVVK